MKNSHNGYINYDFGPAMKLRAESRHNRNGNWKVGVGIALALGTIAANNMFGNPIGKKGSELAANMFRVDETPKEAVCTVDVKHNTWEIAQSIADVENKDPREILYDLDLTNPGKDLGVVHTGDQIGVNREHAPAAQQALGCEPVVKPESQQPSK